MKGIGRWALGGAAAAALALGAGELAAALLGGGSPILAIGAVVIDLQPPGAKDLMVELFGTGDKLVLEVATALGALLFGALIGVGTRFSMLAAMAGIVAFGGVALAAILRDPLVGLSAALIVVAAAVAVGLISLPRLLPRAESNAATALTEQDGSLPTVAKAGQPVERRRFLVVTGSALAVGGLLAFVGRFVGASDSRPIDVRLPRPGEALPPLPAGADFLIDGLSPIVVPHGQFYRIDTRLNVPNLDPDQWRLRIYGMVEHEIEFGYYELLAMPLIERYVTLACVSNEVGGDLVGNARWTGTLLRLLLERAGVQPGATQIVGRSFDGWTAGFPTAHLDGAGSEALVAVGMNGDPLPARHGFPARLVVPGLYGYVSATKWITEIELTTLEAFDAYWVPLGWAKEAPILTQSRIDVPRAGAALTSGPIEAAGVAWAPTRGISAVEIQLDDGAWQPAQVSLALSDAAWVQWRATIDVPAGAHSLRVRATDGTGTVQDSRRTPPAPDGARGYHEIRVAAG
ncbi:molybdopterin-dependent oxidoreductase [soil metagenome]